jgi:hypothetical protein
MRFVATIAILLLSGCTSFPVGSLVVCIGCKVKVIAAPPQTLAEKAGAVAGGFLKDYFGGGK